MSAHAAACGCAVCRLRRHGAHCHCGACNPAARRAFWRAVGGEPAPTPAGRVLQAWLTGDLARLQLSEARG